MLLGASWFGCRNFHWEEVCDARLEDIMDEMGNKVGKLILSYTNIFSTDARVFFKLINIRLFL